MTEWDTSESEFVGAFSWKSSGSIGQEILDAAGRTIAWTTDEWLTQVIVKLLNEQEGLLRSDPDDERNGDK